MTAETFASVSNLTIPTATVVYALALLAHAAEWAASRTVVPEKSKVLVGAGGPSEVVPETTEAPERSEVVGRIGLSLTVLAFACHAVGVLTRGLAAGRVPWGNMYEFTISASLAVAVVYLALVRRYRLRWLGLGVTLLIASALGLAVLALYVPAGDLVPALDSYWLVIHVSAAATAGGAFTIGGLASILYLVKTRAERKGTRSRLPAADSIDTVAYRVLAFAFPVWTFGVLVAGPIWAEHAWGRYWGWDPKEVWSLVTWVVYAAYLHARATAGWRGRRAAIVAVIGWLSFIFNFVGVNLLVSGLHSYAGL